MRGVLRVQVFCLFGEPCQAPQGDGLRKGASRPGEWWQDSDIVDKRTGGEVFRTVLVRKEVSRRLEVLAGYYEERILP